MDVVHRQDPQRVPGQEHLARRTVMHGEGELAAQPREAAWPPAPPRRKQRLGVSLGAPRSPEDLTKLTVVEDLAVEDEVKATSIVGHRLAGTADVDDRQPRVAQRDPISRPGSSVVGTPVVQRGDHRLEHGQVGRLASSVDDAGNSAHQRHPTASTRDTSWAARTDQAASATAARHCSGVGCRPSSTSATPARKSSWSRAILRTSPWAWASG